MQNESKGSSERMYRQRGSEGRRRGRFPGPLAEPENDRFVMTTTSSSSLEIVPLALLMVGFALHQNAAVCCEYLDHN